MNSQEFNNLIPLLDIGNYILTLEKEIEPKSIEDYRAQYFAMRDIVALEAGYSKKEMHELIKSKYHITSTKDFFIPDWQKFIEKLKELALDHFNVYL